MSWGVTTTTGTIVGDANQQHCTAVERLNLAAPWGLGGQGTARSRHLLNPMASSNIFSLLRPSLKAYLMSYGASFPRCKLNSRRTSLSTSPAQHSISRSMQHCRVCSMITCANTVRGNASSADLTAGENAYCWCDESASSQPHKHWALNV